jgi:predicted transcriptional regulator
MPTITIAVGQSYTAELRRRLDEYGVTNAELAREMGVHPSVFARWFRKNGTVPSLASVQRIERALHAILQRRRAERRRNRATGKA